MLGDDVPAAPDVADGSVPPSRAGAAAQTKQARRSERLLTAPVGRTLIELAIPMVLGIGAIILFQVADTIFVGQLGAEQLAAMTFTFPVAFVVFSVTMGLGIGTTSVIARAIGEGDRTKVRRITTHALILAAAVVVLTAALGLAFSEHVFRAMGAKPHLMPLINAYMTPWLLGVGLLVIPMVGNSAIRATGDTKTPSVIMLIAGIANVVLDPLLIFGWGPVPAMGLPGAAYATVLSWSITFLAAAWLLIKRERMVVLERLSWKRLWHSWRQVLFVGLPAAGTNMLIPLSTAVITSFVAGYGENAVAGFGAGTRVEALAMVGINALATAMTPFVGQNYGSGNLDRVKQAASFAAKAALAWGAGAAVLLLLLGAPLARVFNDTPQVIDTTRLYLMTVPLSYGSLGIAMLMNTAFTAMNFPLRASLLVGLRLFLFAVPLAYVGKALWQLHGIFIGVAIGNGVIGLIAIGMIVQLLGKLRRAEPEGMPSR